MNQFNKEIAQALLENTNLTEVFRNQLESTMNSLLESELTAILGYDGKNVNGPEKNCPVLPNAYGCHLNSRIIRSFISV